MSAVTWYLLGLATPGLAIAAWVAAIFADDTLRRRGWCFEAGCPTRQFDEGGSWRWVRGRLGLRWGQFARPGARGWFVMFGRADTQGGFRLIRVRSTKGGADLRPLRNGRRLVNADPNSEDR